MAAGAGFVAGVGRDPFAGPAVRVLAGQIGGKLPTERESPGVKFPPHLRGRDVVRGKPGLFDEPLRNDLFVFPLAVSEHAVGDAGEIAGRHAHPVRWMPADSLAAVVVLEPPMLASNRLEECLDGEFVVGLTRDVLADQRCVSQRDRRVTARRARIERQLRGSRVAAMA